MGDNRDSADVVFRVRAIDNKQKKDPVGASLAFPIRNSPPEVRFNVTDLPSDSTFQFFSFGFSVFDIDGFDNIERVEFSVNSRSGPWHRVDPTTTFISFRVAPNGNATLLYGNNLIADARTIPGFNLNADNRFYIRASDRTGATSTLDSARWYLKQQRSQILFLNDLIGPDRYTRATNHINRLAAIGLTTIDVVDITDGNSVGGFKVPRSHAFPRRTNPTVVEMMASWRYIYWVSDDIDRNISYANEMLVRFFQRGGKLFASMPVKNISPTDPVLSYLSIARIMPLPSGATSFRIPPIGGANRGIVPRPPFSGPVLSASSTVIGIFPLKPIIGSVTLYEADFKNTRLGSVQNVEYPPVGLSDFDETIAIRNPDGNLIFFGMDLLTIDRDNNLNTLLQRLVIEELGFRNN
jgi:hypothetical protein